MMVIDTSPASLTPNDALHKVMNATRKAIEALDGSWDPAAVAAWADHVSRSKGRVVLCGMGKSGIVAQKISATLASTGCPSFFLHPAEALHGDLGMVTGEDTILILSNSGESPEILNLLPSLLRLGIRIAAITSCPDSQLARTADWCFAYSLPAGEGCPLDFAPMSSTTVQMLWGDMLAAHLMAHTQFTLEKFAQFHPAGSIGSKLMKTRDIMSKDVPVVVGVDARLVQVLTAMTQGRLGMTIVKDTSGSLQGVISDGDIRRAVERSETQKHNPLDLTAEDLMTRTPSTIQDDTYAIEAAQVLESRKITFLVVLDDQRNPVGVLHIHHLLSAKVI